MSQSGIAFAGGLLVAGGLVYFYNGLVRQRQLMKEGWSGVDVQLKRRADLIPNLVETVKGYAAHESETLVRIAQLRASLSPSADPVTRGQAETLMTLALAHLFALVENYPELKADENFLDLQKTLTDIEEQIQYARRYYNATARDYNIAVESFPSNIVASLLRFKSATFFELESAAERNVPSVNLS